MNSPTNTDNPYVANEKNKPNDIYTSSIPEISRTHPHPTNTGYGTETQVFTALEARVQHSSVHVTSHNFHELTCELTHEHRSRCRNASVHSTRGRREE